MEASGLIILVQWLIQHIYVQYNPYRSIKWAQLDYLSFIIDKLLLMLLSRRQVLLANGRWLGCILQTKAQR